MKRQSNFACTLQVYNEVIYDLLERSSTPLDLREDVNGVAVVQARRIKVESAEAIMSAHPQPRFLRTHPRGLGRPPLLPRMLLRVAWGMLRRVGRSCESRFPADELPAAVLKEGNARRKTESTDANAQSSRSHAILEIFVSRTERNKARYQVLMGKLSLVDLAGSERAHDTNNSGQKLRDGANINKSLLALANCINALGKSSKGVAYVPYRNSKLTRLLKGSLSGNGRTAMIATVSCGSDQWAHTNNTLKYADRAKEIKTHFTANANMVTSHAIDYQRLIDALQGEVDLLRREIDDKDVQLTQLAAATNAPPPPKAASAAPRGAQFAAPPGLSVMPPAGSPFPFFSPVASPSATGAPGGLGPLSPSAGGLTLVAADPDADLAWVDALTSAMQHNSEERANLQRALFEVEDARVQNVSEIISIDLQLKGARWRRPRTT